MISRRTILSLLGLMTLGFAPAAWTPSMPADKVITVHFLEGQTRIDRIMLDLYCPPGEAWVLFGCMIMSKQDGPSDPPNATYVINGATFDCWVA